ncbi:protein stum homolog [Callorhinchus milii]|uniref:protein stum homolog n=1 Tax=Callorhinchus milii TaxID=7868 RepID=UPI0004573965|nr:protein stum homolog [Callorhinchus milii]|eukprot:gi/632953682/ref/XP_007892557.1/ PREDICTED: protein SPEC3-like [Callorhinchus milii]
MDSLSSLVAVAQEGFRKDQEDWKKHSDVLHRKPTKMTGAIPHMSTSLAVICLVLNILAPGTGTVLSGFSLLCCSEPRTLPSHKSSDETLALVCLNVWVGIAQLFTVPFLLVGWLWSITWGVMMVNLSCERKSPAKPQTTIAGMKSPVVFLPSWMSDPVK